MHSGPGHIYYELDQQTVKTVLRLSEYGGEEDMAWHLLDELWLLLHFRHTALAPIADE